MKKMLLFVLFSFFSFSFGFAQNVELAIDDDQLIDAVGQIDNEITREDISLKKLDSCEALSDIIKENQNINWGGLYYERDDFAVEELADVDMESTQTSDNSVSDGVGWGSDMEYSTTNNQKKWVDEPDIIKSNWEYIFYYTAQKNAIYILKSPVDWGEINIENANVVKKINLLENLYNIQIFIKESELYILWTASVNSKWSIFGSSRTYVITYDFSDVNNLKLAKISLIDGGFMDARLIWDVLHVITTNYVDYWYLSQLGDDFDISQALLPKSIDVDVMNDGSFDVEVANFDCNNVNYFASEDAYNFGITNITSIDTTKKENSMKTNAVLSSYGQMHVSEDNLYLVSNYYTYGNSRCGMWYFCIMPIFFEWSNSVIHKFGIDWNNVEYEESNIVMWSPLNQYSMDEDSDWNFRIITRWDWWEGTNVFVLDDELNLVWKLTNIQPDEQFQSARYIWDKLYMVTFEQTDPLFVIDLADIENPEIIWELHMPGYSTYLHPMGWEDDSKQYLIWLWFDVEENQRWGVQNAWLKLWLYLVDYSKKETLEAKCGALAFSWASQIEQDAYEDCVESFDSDNIYVKIVDEKILWDNGSTTEALYNPRMFVMDSNNNVTLPLLLNEEAKVEVCTKYYNDALEVESEKCYKEDNYDYQTSFVWLKTFGFDDRYGITEKFSKNYLDSEDIEDIDYESYWYSNLGYSLFNSARVWYIWDALYFVNNYFADFIEIGGEDNLLIFE